MNQLFQILVNGGIVLGVFVILLLNNKGVRKTRANTFLSVLLGALTFSTFHLRYAGDFDSPAPLVLYRRTNGWPGEIHVSLRVAFRPFLHYHFLLHLLWVFPPRKSSRKLSQQSSAITFHDLLDVCCDSVLMVSISYPSEMAGLSKHHPAGSFEYRKRKHFMGTLFHGRIPDCEYLSTLESVCCHPS